jgi:hypothetical protein
MAYQNINQYNYPKLKMQVIYDGQDMSLASDEVDYNQEVIFSPFIIGAGNGEKLPVNVDLNSAASTLNIPLIYGQYNLNNVVVSDNYYQPEGLRIDCFSANTTCDIGLTGIDNGLVTQIEGQTLNFTNGLFTDAVKFNRMYYDRRMKFIQPTTNVPFNNKFSGIPQYTAYEMVTKNAPDVGRYVELYGGFYQGFYKLFGYDYEILPERMKKGWSVEMILKPRFIDEYQPKPGYTTLNQIYPNNKNTFFYLGARAENKFYHYADGSPKCDPSYKRVTSELKDCFETCACCDYEVTNSRCIYVYPPRPIGGVWDPHVNYGCNLCNGEAEKQISCGCGCNLDPCDTCGWMCFQHKCSSIIVPSPTPTPTPTPIPPCDTYPTTVVCPPVPCCTSCPNCGCDTCGCPPEKPSTIFSSIENTCETDPLFDALSNNFSVRLCGDPKNPGIGIRVVKITGGCETSGTCITGQTYTTGYTIQDICTPPIYPYCEQVNPAWLNFEHWFQVNIVFERYTFIDFCDLRWFGGLDQITRVEFLASLANNSISLIQPPVTNGYEIPQQVEIVQLNDIWIDETKFRLGRLKIYINGKIFYTIEDFEEVIPRPLDTDKEKQVAVPFNMSWGGGTQGLHENLTLSACSATTVGNYIQDPECFPENILQNTSLNKLKTHILLEENFGGTFDGGISQFRFYTEPLSSPEVKHNFKLLKDKFKMFDPDCPVCTTVTCAPNDFTYEISDTTTTTTTSNVTTTTTTSGSTGRVSFTLG